MDSSKLKEFADDNFKFDENGIKFFKRLENTVVKEEIPRYEQFLLFPQYFQDLFLRRVEPQGLFGKELSYQDWKNVFLNRLISVISVELWENTITILISTGKPVSMEYETARVDSLSRMQISEITRLKIRYSGS